MHAIANSSFNLEIYDNSNNSIVFYSPRITETNVSNANINKTFLYELDLGKGDYSLNIINTNNSPLFLSLYYAYTPNNINPLVYNESTYARGLAAYGIENNSGKITNYNIATNALMGFADINSLYSYYSSEFGQSHQISLQLNGVLVVKNNDNKTFTYWIQDVANINSQDRAIFFSDNVWNYSYYSPTPFILTNKSIVGNGAVYTYPSNNQNFYVFSTNESYFNYPLSFALIEAASVENNSGVNINACYQPLQGNVYNSSLLEQRIGCYDNITIKDPNAEYAYFYVSGNEYPDFEIPPFYDAEFVLGGGYNGSHSVVQSLNADLGLYYYNESTTSYVQFPSYYPIGADTGETADNVNINYNGISASATAGNDNLDYLGQSATFMPIIDIKNINFTALVNFTNMNEVQNYSAGNLTGFSTSAGNYYTYYVITPDIFSQYTCTLPVLKYAKISSVIIEGRREYLKMPIYARTWIKYVRQGYIL